MAGLVFIDGNMEDKPGTRFDLSCAPVLKGESCRYVSRGGLKLEKALDEFNIDLEGALAIDVGSSTGGFTDCMLQRGALSVYSVDVGYGQLAWKLRTDPRVVSMERTNARYLKTEDFPEGFDFATIDVSFISLKKILPALAPLMKKKAVAVALIKPQFEAGREKVGKRGVIKSMETHTEVLTDILDASNKIGFDVKGLTYSPVKGPNGNIEFLVCLQSTDGSEAFNGHPVKIFSNALSAVDPLMFGRLAAEVASEAHAGLDK